MNKRMMLPVFGLLSLLCTSCGVVWTYQNRRNRRRFILGIDDDWDL